MKRIDRDNYELSSGRKIYANHGLISISDNRDDAHDPGWEIGEGYDGHLSEPNSSHELDDPPLTAEEREELADFMIEQWQRFKQDTCKTLDHDWTPWLEFSQDFAGRERILSRHCRRCLTFEEKPVLV
jgi:hypothetical protein